MSKDGWTDGKPAADGEYQVWYWPFGRKEDGRPAFATWRADAWISDLGNKVLPWDDPITHWREMPGAPE